MNRLIGQLMFIGVSGPALTSDEKKFIVENNIGGVILFTRNIVDPRQLHSLCSEIQSLRKQQPDRAPLFIGVDMEGGRVHRLKTPFTKWPAPKMLGLVDNPAVTFAFASKMGLELKSVGFNVNFAPCVDVLTNPANTAIGDRSLGSDPALVEKHASALVRGYIKSGVICCVKHFPGHGNTVVDSHDELPVEDLDKAHLDSIEIPPFKRALKARADMLLPAHIRFPRVDPKWPASLSEVFLKNILRGEIRYKGLVVTDDLDMGALIKNFSREEIAVRSLEAGNDILLYCNDPTSPPLALESITSAIAQGRLSKADLESRKARILELKKERLAQPEPPPFTEAVKVIGHPEHLRIAEAVAQGQTPEGLLPE